MNQSAKTIVNKIDQYNPDKALSALTKIMVFTFCFIIIGSTVSPALAATADGDPSGLISVFKRLGEIFISIAYSLMVIVFAVGTVKSGLSAQVSQQFGIAGRASVEVMNLIGGVLVFVIGLLSLPLVRWILGELGDIISPDLSLEELPTFTSGGTTGGVGPALIP